MVKGKKNDLTFVIVTWNNEKEIVNCLTSIQKLYDEQYDVLVVDNKSKDQTILIVEKKFPNVKLIRLDENLGFAKANNIGLLNLKTEYICFLNPDTILTEDIIHKAIEILENNQKVGLIAARLLNEDGTIQKSCFNFSTPFNMFLEIMHIGDYMPQIICKHLFPYNYCGNKVISPDWVIGAEFIMRREDVLKISGFSEEYFMYTEDMDLCKKVRTYLKKEIICLPDCTLVHLGGASENQNVSYNKQKKLLENNLHFVEKFYGKKKSNLLLNCMRFAYKIRYFLLKTVVNNDIAKEKTKKAIRILMEMEYVE